VLIGETEVRWCSVRKYICSICKEEYYSIENILQHLKSASDELHQGIDKQDLDSYFDIIDLDSREWTDIEQRRIRLEPIKTEPSVPKDLLPQGWIRAEEYPTKPYYYYDGQYWCSEHKFLTKSETEFLVHVLTHHTNDFDKVLKHVVEQSLLKKVTTDVTRKELQNLMYEEVRQWLRKVDEVQPDALNFYFQDYYHRLFAFLRGDIEVCPICSKVATVDNKYHLDKIMYCLLKGAKEYEHLRKKLEAYQGKEANWLLNELYPCLWNGKEIGMKLLSVLHIYQDHKPTFEELVKANVLSGKLIDFLHHKKYLNKETQPPILKGEEPTEKLSRGVVIKKQVQLSKSEEALLKWLDKERTKKE
jgi:hypothetical protein